MMENQIRGKAKIRDKWRCVACGVEDRFLVLDEQGKPHHIISLHAAHLNKTCYALWEYDNTIGSLHLLDFVDSPLLRKTVFC